MTYQPGHRESATQTWARRSVTLSALAVGTVVATATAPAWSLVLAAWDIAVPGKAPWRRLRAALMAAAYLYCEAAGILAAGGLWLAHLMGALRGPGAFLEANARLQRLWTGLLFATIARLYDLTIQVHGAAQARNGPLLFFVRHCSSADTLLTAALVANPFQILLRYVLKSELLADPCLDVVGQRLPNVFVARGQGRAAAETAAIARLAVDLAPNAAVVIYPEGTRYSALKRQAALRALGEKGRPDLLALAQQMKLVLPPKPAGALALLRAAPGTDVVFVDHTGLEGAATLGRIWRGDLIGATLRVRLRRVAAADIPSSNRDVWLYQQWLDTAAWVEAAASPQGAA